MLRAILRGGKTGNPSTDFKSDMSVKTKSKWGTFENKVLENTGGKQIQGTYAEG